MATKDPSTVPFLPEPRPQEVLIDGARLDGRSFEEFRNVFFQTNVISQASGSSYAEFRNTKVMIGVYGPRQSERRISFSEQGKINCDFKLATFSSRQRGKFGQSSEEREYSSMMQTALEAAVQLSSFPKAVVDVYCLVLEAGGAELAVAITAASLALADAGIEMRDLVTACSVSLVHDKPLLDPSADEVFREEAGLLLAMMPTDNEITHLVARGSWSDARLKEGLELCMGGCLQLDGAVRQCLKDAGATAAVGNTGHAEQRQRDG